MAFLQNGSRISFHFKLPFMKLLVDLVKRKQYGKVMLISNTNADGEERNHNIICIRELQIIIKQVVERNIMRQNYYSKVR